MASPPTSATTPALPPLALELAEALLEAGPRTAPELRRLLRMRDARAAKRALELLQRLLVVTQVGEREQEQGWPAAVFDLVACRFRGRLRRLPPADRAQTRLAEAVLRAAGEVSAADLAAALGLPRRDAAAALARLEQRGRARRREADGTPLWGLLD